MAKKVVELKATKRKVELKEMSIDDMDFCSDLTTIKMGNDGEIENIGNMSKSRTAWLRRGIAGGDFNSFKIINGKITDKVLRQLSDDEKNELLTYIQDYQKMGEAVPSQ